MGLLQRLHLLGCKVLGSRAYVSSMEVLELTSVDVWPWKFNRVSEGVCLSKRLKEGRGTI